MSHRFYRRYHIAIMFLALTVAVPAKSNPLAGFSMVDLTHSFDEDTIYWPTEKDFEHDAAFVGVTDGGWYYSAFSLHTAEHGGTHMDAPIHFSEGKWAADEVPLSSLITPVVVIDVSAQSADNPDYRLSVEVIEQWEREHGRIPERATVLMNTGFAQYWPDRERYMGTAKRGAEGVAALHFPGFSADAATFLMEKRGIVAVGLDTPSIDFGQSKDFIVHQLLFENNVIGLENLANLNVLPAVGAYLIALPMKIRGGSGGPLRAVGLVPTDEETQ